MIERFIKLIKYFLSVLFIYRIYDYVRYFFGVPYFYDIFLHDNSNICIIAPYYSLLSFKKVTCFNYLPNITKDPYKACLIVTYSVPPEFRLGPIMHIQLKKNGNVFYETFITANQSVTRYRLAITTLFKYEIEYISEWIEHHTKLGVEHFYLYDNNEMGNNRALHILEPYIKKGLVTYVRWPHPYIFYNFKIRNLWPHDWYGYCQSGQLNHVLYKFGFQAKWLLLCDIDEYFYQPRSGKNITEILSAIETKEIGKEISSFVIKGKWFGGRAEDVLASRTNGVVKTFILSETGFTSPPKYILNTDIVTLAGVHSIITNISGEDINVPADVLMFNHYRALGWKKRIDQNFATEVENSDIIHFK